jgi:lipoate-protein ligase A
VKLFIFESVEHNPYLNLAAERYLTLHVEPESLILFLWQNRNTVVIGRNQNCYAECNIAEIEAGGGQIARRLSGGGAVYHDLGNLNFSFIASHDLYDVSRQLEVITNAVNCLNLPYSAKKTGRNDIEINGAKFSGNAFLQAENCCHHGTILISADFDKLVSYIRVSSEKTAYKGVKSVRSRVINLSELGEVSVPDMKKALYNAFEREYEAEAEPLLPKSFEENELLDLNSFFSAKNWIYNKCYSLEYTVAARFDWGKVEVDFNVHNGQISEIQVFTDALETDLAETIKSALIGQSISCYTPVVSPYSREIDIIYKIILNKFSI